MRAYVAATKGTGRRRVGRRAGWLPGDGRRRKNEAGDEPQGGTSRGAFGTRAACASKGGSPSWRLGILSARVLAGFALSATRHNQCDFDILGRHWGSGVIV